MEKPTARVALAMVLLLSVWAVFSGRRAFIQTFFVRGPGGAGAPRLIGVEAKPALAPAARMRVVLIDGVDRTTAHALPAYDQLCKQGLDLTIDVGFPTVSLPVQSVLWTGLTQQQTGIQFVPVRIEPPPESLPARVAGSVAIAEYHPFIVHSFGFDRAEPDMNLAGGDLEAWKTEHFAVRAVAEVAGDAPLVFVHILRADTAGHKQGRDSARFADAARTADALLAQLVAADHAVHGSSSRWLVLSDHGHRAAGGHGGPEPSIRRVRGCMFGAGIETFAHRPGQLIHLVDIHRAMADSLAASAPARSAGRPLAAALAAPVQGDATLPSPSTSRWVVAALLLLLAVVATGWATGRSLGYAPWWLAVAVVSLVAIEGLPSLSTPMVYRPRGQSVYMAALPGLLLLAITCGYGMRRRGAVRTAVAQLAIPAALVAAALVLCWGKPPLMPRYTAYSSIAMILWFSGALVVALAALATLVPYGSDRSSPPETTRKVP